MLIDLATAKAHLRLGASYANEQVLPYLNAAESAAAQFLNRRVYADQDALDTAVAAVPLALMNAGLKYRDRMAVAADLEDPTAQCKAEAFAAMEYTTAKREADETYAGIVLNAQVEAAILLVMGHLFESREDVAVGVTVTALPYGSLQLLFPFRVGLGA